jgi:hypothetical protein
MSYFTRGRIKTNNLQQYIADAVHKTSFHQEQNSSSKPQSWKLIAGHLNYTAPYQIYSKFCSTEVTCST